jgi:PAS domain S-box-containing protein
LICIINAESLKFEEVNQAVKTLLGYTTEEIKGTSLLFYLKEEDRQRIQNLSKENKEKFSFEASIYCKERTVKWLNWNIVNKNGFWFANARDITETKDVEEIKNYLSTVVKQSNEAIYLHDQYGKIISWNEGATEIYGYTEAEALKMKIWNIIPEHLLQEAQEKINKIMQGEKILGFETKRITKHGKIIDVLFSASVLLDVNNNLKSIAITERDITLQKRSEEQIKQLNADLQKNISQLKEREEQIQTIFRNAPEAVIVIDEEGKITSWNPMAEAIFGWTPDEVIGKNLHETIIPQRFREAHLKGLKHFLKTGEGPILNKPLELHACKKDNTEIDAGLRISQTYLKGKYYFIGFVSDITFRKKAEAEIRQKKEQLEAINKQLQMFAAMAESSFDFVSMADMNGDIFYLNRGGRLLMGLEPDEAPPKPIADYCEPATWKLLQKEGLPAVLERGWWEGEGKLRNFRTGELWDAAMRTFMVTDPTTNQPLCIAAIDSNITEQKKAEKKLEQSNKELEKVIQQLNQVNNELESFSYSVSHDLRAPLRSINGYAQIILEEHQPLLNEELKRLFGIIQNNAKRMGTLIDDLLAFSRLGRRPLTKTPVNFNDLVHQVVKDQEGTFHVNTSISIHSLKSTEGDQTLLYQVFANLISNAIKYSGKKETPRIEIGFLENDDEYIYYIKDNGAGFNMEYAHKLFGVFQRLHSNEEFEGTGVGLAIVQRIIAKHGGRVWAEGEINKGATFYFSLPKPLTR